MNRLWKLWLSALAAGWLLWGCAPGYSQTLVEFVQPGCVPCAQQKPAIDQIRAEGHQVDLVDIAADPVAKAKWQIQSTPTVVLFDVNGHEVRRIKGAQPVEVYRQWFAEIGAKPPTSTPAGPQAAATPTALAPYHKAIVSCGRLPYAGTGTLVARNKAGQGMVLTAAHVVEQGGQSWVDFGKGMQSAWIIGTDKYLDVAALGVNGAPSDIEPIAVADATEWPKQGDSVEVVGYGGGNFRHFSAPVRGYTTKDVNGQSQLVVDFHPISGDSGGPILFKRKLVGILWGGPAVGPKQPAFETHGTCSVYINKCLETWGCIPRRGPPITDAPPAGNPPTVVTNPPATPPLTPIAGQPGTPGQNGNDGRDGQPGAPGVKGDKGDPGSSPDPAAIVAAVTNQLKQQPITFRIRDASGNVLQQKQAYLGGNVDLVLRFVPK